MTNALQVLNSGTELTELELLIMETADEEENAYDFIPTRIKIGTGGINTFMTDSDDPIKEIVGIIPVSQKVRAYWPAKSRETSTPLCVSGDSVAGVLNADAPTKQIDDAMRTKTTHPGVKLIAENKPLPASFDCYSCPLAQWNSANEGRGQACKLMIRMVILIDGWTTPALLTLPPTSVKAFSQYASSRRSQKSAYFAVRSKLTLQREESAGGDPYSVLKIAQVEGDAGNLTADELRAVLDIRKQYAEFIRDLPVDDADYTTAAAIDNDDETPF